MKKIACGLLLVLGATACVNKGITMPDVTKTSYPTVTKEEDKVRVEAVYQGVYDALERNREDLFDFEINAFAAGYDLAKTLPEGQLQAITMGLNFGMGLKEAFPNDTERAAVIAAILDVKNQKESRLSGEALEKARTGMQEIMKKAQEALAAKKTEEAKKRDEAKAKFLSDNPEAKARKAKEEEAQKTKEAADKAKAEKAPEEEKEYFTKLESENANIKKTESGLRYTVEKEGEGDAIKKEDTVSVLYKGTLKDGTVFDSTESRGNAPAEFPVAGVVPGFSEALQMMKKGSKMTVHIPFALAYGTVDNGPIPAYSTLKFEIEVVDVKKGEAVPAAEAPAAEAPAAEAPAAEAKKD